MFVRDPFSHTLQIARWPSAEAEAGPVQAEEDAGVDMDYFDRQDLGKLRRRLRKGIEGFQRERELYLELVQEFLEVPARTLNPSHTVFPVLSAEGSVDIYGCR